MTRAIKTSSKEVFSAIGFFFKAIGVTTVVSLLGAAQPAKAVNVNLTPSTPIDVSRGFGIGFGTVSSGHEIFNFNAFAKDVVTLDVNVTKMLPGTEFQDDDSKLFLFDSVGTLLAENDDEPSGSLQSLISNFLIPKNGTYFVGVTSYDNSPILDANNIITGWTDDGKSNIEYNLVISRTPVPEPLTIMGSITAAGMGIVIKKKLAKKSLKST